MPTESNAILHLSMAGPMIAGVLVGIVVISAAVVICFLQCQPKRTYRRRRSFEAPFILRHGMLREWRSAVLLVPLIPLLLFIDSHSQRTGLLRDEIPSENYPRKKKCRRYSRRSRHSSGTVELDALQDGNRPKARKMPLRLGDRQWRLSSGSTNSTFSLALNMKKMGVNHHIVDRSQTLATIVSSTVSSKQVDPRPKIELPLLSSSQNEPIHPSNHINPASLPEVERHPPTQQRATAGNTSDKSVNGELSEGQDLSPDAPPSYEPER